MTSSTFDFASLIQPLSAEKFFAEHWQRQPLLLQRSDPAYYAPLLALGDLEALISQGDVRYPAIRLAKGGAFFPPESYTHDLRYGDELFSGVADVEKIVTEYQAGATVTLPALHRSWPALGQLCAQMEADLDHAVHTNAYLTPALAPGFTPHYDTHEVFVLQIAGSKHWRVYPPPLKLPHRSQPFSPEHYALPPRALLECELVAGDLLYLPRGHVHTTTAGPDASAHVTIGVSVYTWIEMLSELLQQAADTPELREALPPGFAHRPELRSGLEERLAQRLRALTHDADARDLTERFLRRVHMARPRTAARFRANTTQLGADSALRIAPGLAYRILPEREGIVLEIQGRRVHLQSAVAPALEAMRHTESFTAASLPATISLAARLSLVRYLHGLGFLQPR